MDDLAGHFQLWGFYDSLTHLKPFLLFAKQTLLQNKPCLQNVTEPENKTGVKIFSTGICMNKWTIGIWIVQDYGENEFLKSILLISFQQCCCPGDVVQIKASQTHDISSSFLLCWSFLLSYAEHCSCNFFSIISEFILLFRGSKLEQTTTTTWV